MILPFTSGLIRTTHHDQEVVALVDRHYSRRPGQRRQVGGPARKLVLRDAAGSAVFIWLWPQDGKRWDGQVGFYCSVFRNESARQSSDVIREAEELAAAHWGGVRRMFTYVDPSRVRSRNPGYCFLMAPRAADVDRKVAAREGTRLGVLPLRPAHEGRPARGLGALLGRQILRACLPTSATQADGERVFAHAPDSTSAALRTQGRNYFLFPLDNTPA